jgi:hypothetical protein
MRKRHFLTPVYPQEKRSNLHVQISFFIWCQWLCNRPGSSGQLFVMERIFFAPHLPFSVIPHQFAQRLDLRLTLLQRDPEISRIATQYGLVNADPQIATLRFVDHLTTPRKSDRRRTFGFLALLPASAGAPQWPDPHLGADFLLEHGMRLFLDYGRLRYRSSPVDPGHVQFDPNEPCGYLEYLWDPGTPQHSSVSS